MQKGPEALLPEGRTFRDKQGHTRNEVRLRWWDPVRVLRPFAMQHLAWMGEKKACRICR